jgi:hypothetical protein
VHKGSTIWSFDHDAFDIADAVTEPELHRRARKKRKS